MSNLVLELRKRTGAGFADCKAALEQTQNNIEAAIDYLKVKGILKSESKLQRSTDQGIIYSYIHHDRRTGVLIELNCETDFVAINADFRKLAHNLCLHIVANRPEYLSRNQVPVLDESREREVSRLKAIEEGRPEKIIDRIVEGRMAKFYQTLCLLEQSYLFDESQTVEDFLKGEIIKFGENIRIKRFALFILGEEQAGNKTEEKYFN